MHSFPFILALFTSRAGDDKQVNGALPSDSSLLTQGFLPSIAHTWAQDNVMLWKAYNKCPFLLPSWENNTNKKNNQTTI